MNDSVKQASAWVYEGIWGILANWFVVPRGPPNLPLKPGDTVDQRHPDERFLDYLKLQFWIGNGFLNLIFLISGITLTVAVPLLGLIVAPIVLGLLAITLGIGYLALHLRYDTTWYVLSNRSMRIRRGIWVLHETTITYDNIQNIHIHQGPLQRWFGISNILVETAGGGGGGQGAHAAPTHMGILEGLLDAEGIRELILEKVRQLKSAGLGDEAQSSLGMDWSPQHLERLREIRQTIGQINDPSRLPLR